MVSQSEQDRAAGSAETIEETTKFSPRLDANGLIPAIVLDANTNDVAMFAWMNQQSIAETRRTGLAHFWSRSRKKIWCKGEESGNRLRVRRIRTDCDQDCLLIDAEVEGDGVACHTLRQTCFYRQIEHTDSNDGVQLSFID